MSEGEFTTRIAQNEGNGKVIHSDLLREWVAELKHDIEAHAINLKVESAFVTPPAQIETLKAIPLSIWEKWFGENK